MLNEVKHLALVKRDSSAAPQNDTHHLTCDEPLAIEIGMQNAGLGTALALKHLGEKAAIPAALFVFVCIITASVAAQVWRKHPSEISPANNIY